MESKEPRLTSGSVSHHLINMTVPVLFGISMLMLQGFVDAYFIGQVGDRELAALSFGYPILMIVTSVAIGLGAGTSSVVARAIGAQNLKRARRLATDSLLLSFLITGSISMLGIITIFPLFRILGAPEEMIPLIAGYMRILYFGVPFMVVGMVGMACMRATGDTRLPSMLMVIASIANIILDPIFIFGFGPIPEMGLDGAAMAALIARGSIFLGTLVFMYSRLDMLSFNVPKIIELKSSWFDILHVGVPAAATNAIIPLATAIITAMLARYGPDAVAGFGVASRIESLALVMFYALSAIIGPFVGQNTSAGKTDRILRALRLCMIFCVFTGLMIALMLFLMSNFLVTLFSNNPVIIGVAIQFLLIVPISYGAHGVVMIMTASFNGMGKPIPAVVISVGRMMALYVPMAFLLGYFYGIAGIFIAYGLANVLSGIVAYFWARFSVRGQIEKVA